MVELEDAIEIEFYKDLTESADKKQPGESIRVGAPFTAERLRTMLHGAGMHRVHPWQPVDRRDGFSYLAAHKPDHSPVKGVVAIMSLPRYGLTSNFGCVVRAMKPAGIDVFQGFGVYWSEVMTAMMAQLVKNDTRYILTIDYDSVFDAADVLHLVHLMDQTPDAGAICGVQMRRTKPSALLTMKDGATKIPTAVFEQELVEVRTAHFGLTVIRVDALRKLSKPWFQAQPDTNGEWNVEAGYVAADIAFWQKFESEGHKLYQANMVAIGHIEEMIVWPSRTLSPVVQNMDEYREIGIPDAALR